MIYPCLVLKSLCQTPITVKIAKEGLSEDGEPISDVVLNLNCNYQDTAKAVLTDEKKYVQITGRAFFVGDISPENAVISSGTATVFGIERRIVQGMKARNPDGTVNYTRLDLE